jgi:hypothetical protein
MSNGWASQRKLVYGAGLLVALVLLFVYAFRNTLFPTATCFDGRQNAFESGIDCGGECSLRCFQDVIPLATIWARALRTSSTTYDLAALVSNKNIDNAPKQMGYVFKVYDRNGTQIKEVAGTTTVPIDGDFPIIEQSVTLQSEPGNVHLVLESETSYYRVLEKPAAPTLRITDRRYESGAIPRVYATISNNKRVALRDIPVRVILYDVSGNAYAAGKTIIPFLDKEGKQEVVFTWDRAFGLDPTNIIVYPIFDPFLGSF